jgi:Ca2+-binding EF-hand superfamily protein
LLGIPRDTVNRLYQEFIASTGKDNQMDKKEFRRLYKEFYLVEQPDATGPTALSDHELDKLADRVFKAFDRNGTGKLTFEGNFIFLMITDNFIFELHRIRQRIFTT